MYKTQTAQHITSDRIATYRGYDPMDIDEQIEALQAFDDRRVLAIQEGDERMEAAATRAWLQDAILLAATPATPCQAKRKVDYLRRHLDGWLLISRHADENRAYAAMIEAAIAAECERWDLTASVECGTAEPEDAMIGFSRLVSRLLAPAWMDGHYAHLAVPTTVSAAIETLDGVKADVKALRGTGDAAVIEAALTLRDVGLLELVGAAALSRADLKKKAGHIVRHGRLEPAYLVHPMIGAALRADAARLGLTSEQAAKVPGARGGVACQSLSASPPGGVAAKGATSALE